MNLEEGPNGLEGMIEYNTDLFDRETIHRMVGHLEQILDVVAQHPHSRLSEVALLSDHEKDLVVNQWNHQPQQYDYQDTIHQRFEHSVEIGPDRVAVSMDGVSLTYAELNARSNQLAHYLRAQGVKANDLVGVCLERSLDMVIAILGVLKAGGAYVPLDPTNPQDRLNFIVSDSDVVLLITQSSVANVVERDGLNKYWSIRWWMSWASNPPGTQNR